VVLINYLRSHPEYIDEKRFKISVTNISNTASAFDPVNYYNHTEDTEVSVSIKQCTLSDSFVSEILKRFSAIYSG